MSINSAPTLNHHDPTNPHPVSVVSGWNPAEECPELTRISPGLLGITQAGEGLSMIASLVWGGGAARESVPIHVEVNELWNTVHMVVFTCDVVVDSARLNLWRFLQDAAHPKSSRRTGTKGRRQHKRRKREK